MNWAYLLLMTVIIVALLLVLVASVTHGYFMLTNSVPYVVLPDGAMAQVVTALGVRDEDVVYDLGCGDGRVLLALQKHNSHARYTGVENDWAVWLRARGRLRGRVRLVRGDIAGVQLDTASRIFVYLGPKLMRELEPRFEKELDAGARVVSVQFPLPNRRPDQVVELKDSKLHAARLYVYNY